MKSFQSPKHDLGFISTKLIFPSMTRYLNVKINYPIAGVGEAQFVVCQPTSDPNGKQPKMFFFLFVYYTHLLVGQQMSSSKLNIFKNISLSEFYFLYFFVYSNTPCLYLYHKKYNDMFSANYTIFPQLNLASLT